MDDHVETLRRYNRWRRGQDCEEMQDPRVVGDAIDAACDKIDRLRAELAERGLALRQCIRDYNEVVADNDKLRAELAECRAAINDFLVGVSVYNDRLKPGRCAEPIEGPVIDALRAAAHKGEGEKE